MKKRIGNLSPKVKLRLTWIALLLLCWLIYPLTIAKTLELRAQVNELQALNDSIADLPLRQDRVEEELLHLASLNGLSGDKTVTRESILQEVTTACANHEVILREFSACRRYSNEDWTIETHPVIIEGEFTAMLQAVHEIERKGSGTTVSVTFFNHTDKQSKKRSTRAQLFIQNMITAP